MQDPSFRGWFLTQVASASGTMTQSVAASWLVLQITGSAVDLGVLAALTLTPVLFGAAAAGSLVDRVDRRTLLVWTQTAYIVLGSALTVLSASHRLTLAMIYGSAVLTGAVTAVDAPARQVFVLDLVGRERLASAVSLYEVVLNLSRVIGPGLGGILLALSGATACFGFNVLTYVPPLVVLLRRRSRRVAATGRDERADAGVWQGIRYAFSVPAIRGCLVMAAVSGVLFNAAVLFPLLAQRSFHMGPDGYGALIAAFGLGALPGGLLASMGDSARSSRTVALLGGLTGLATIATATAPDALWAFAGMAVTGFVSIWFIASANTLVQMRAEPHMRGRVMGVWTMALPGMNPVTALVFGLVADLAGPRSALASAGALLLVCAGAAWYAVRHESAGQSGMPLRLPMAQEAR